MTHSTPDQDAGKGAKEADDRQSESNVGQKEQLGHRDQDSMLKDADTDFPEPGESPEHTGEPQRKSA